MHNSRTAALAMVVGLSCVVRSFSSCCWWRVQTASAKSMVSVNLGKAWRRPDRRTVLLSICGVTWLGRSRPNRVFRRPMQTQSYAWCQQMSAMAIDYGLSWMPLRPSMEQSMLPSAMPAAAVPSCLSSRRWKKHRTSCKCAAPRERRGPASAEGGQTASTCGVFSDFSLFFGCRDPARAGMLRKHGDAGDSVRRSTTSAVTTRSMPWCRE